MQSQSAANIFPAFYVGNYDHVLDAQGRVSLPSDWRSKDQETEMVMIPTRDQALLLPRRSKTPLARTASLSISNSVNFIELLPALTTKIFMISDPPLDG